MILDSDVNHIHHILIKAYIMEKIANTNEDFFAWNVFLKQKTKKILFHFKR